jgi:hypothetical protein
LGALLKREIMRPDFKPFFIGGVYVPCAQLGRALLSL